MADIESQWHILSFDYVARIYILYGSSPHNQKMEECGHFIDGVGQHGG